MRAPSIILATVFAVAFVPSVDAAVNDDLLKVFATSPSIDDCSEFASRDPSRQYIVIASDAPAATEREAVEFARSRAREAVASRIADRFRAVSSGRAAQPPTDRDLKQIVNDLFASKPVESKAAVRAVERSYGTLYRAILLVDVTDHRIAELASKVQSELRRRHDERVRTVAFRLTGYGVSIFSPIVVFAVLNRLTRGYLVHILAPAGAAVALAGLAGTTLLL
jgi:hypothetical protein